jgi:hypothetical protein
MPAAMIQTPYEAGRLFANAYEGKAARLCLANTTAGSPGLNSTIAQWDAVELTGNGYARYEWTIPAGSYNNTTERWEAAAELSTFTAAAGGAGLSWNAAYLAIDFMDGVSFVLNETSTVTLAAGQTRGYSVLLFSDGFLLTA